MKFYKKTTLENYPQLIKEFHPSKNGKLKPKDFTKGSHKKVWWLCTKGHEWWAELKNRTLKGTSCPYCSGHRVSKENSLKFLFPELMKEWHPSKNGKLKPEDFHKMSHKEVWWQCTKNHEWKTEVYKRTFAKLNCPYCSGHRVSEENNLKVLFPKLVKEWHPTKNNKNKPEHFTKGASKKVWWLCTKGHEWKTEVYVRTRGGDCPYCAGKRASKENNLKVLLPELMKEWHQSKNGKLKPEHFVKGSHKRVWWQCKKGHEWQTMIYARTYLGNSCPRCTYKSSKAELRILSEIEGIFSDVYSRYKFKKTEIDIFVKEINLGIEYDGFYYHKNKIEDDRKKNNFLNKNGINVIRVRKTPLEKISLNDILVKNEVLKKSDLNSIMQSLQIFSGRKKQERIKEYFKKKNFINEKVFNKYLSYFPSPIPEKSLISVHSKFQKEWNYEKNYPLKPEYFYPGSNHRVWWQCTKGHEWQQTISNRNYGKVNCPHCSRRRVHSPD